MVCYSSSVLGKKEKKTQEFVQNLQYLEKPMLISIPKINLIKVSEAGIFFSLSQLIQPRFADVFISR